MDDRDRSITSRKLGHGWSHTAQVRLKGAKPISKTFKTIAGARKWRDESEARVRGELGRPADSRPFLEERLVDTIGHYLDIPEHESGPKKKARMHLSAAKEHLGELGPVGEATNGELGPRWCRQYWEGMSRVNTKRGAPYMPATIAKHFTVMGAAYKRRAQQLGADVARSPFTRSILPPDWNEGRERRFEPGEEEALLRLLSSKPSADVWLSLVNLTLATGARLQELLLATWSEFHVSQGKPYWRIPKRHSKTGARTVPLSPEAVEALRTLAALKKTGERRLFWQYSGPDSASAIFRGHREEAGLTDFTFHDLRHEAISRLVVERWWMSYAVIGKMVGHSTSEITDSYTHLRPEELLSAFEGPADWQTRPIDPPSPFMAPAILITGRQRNDERDGPAAQIGAQQAPPRKALGRPRKLALAA